MLHLLLTAGLQHPTPTHVMASCHAISTLCALCPHPQDRLPFPGTTVPTAHLCPCCPLRLAGRCGPPHLGAPARGPSSQCFLHERAPSGCCSAWRPTGCVCSTPRLALSSWGREIFSVSRLLSPRSPVPCHCFARLITAPPDSQRYIYVFQMRAQTPGLLDDF